MKRLVLTGIATLAFAAGVLAQGIISLDNTSDANYGVAIGAAGTYYTGSGGIEVWELSSGTLPGNINGAVNTTAYGNLATDGFVLEQTFNGVSFASGTFNKGQITLGHVPAAGAAGSSIVLGLAIWNTGATSWANMLGAADGNTRAGVLAFVQQSVDPTVVPPPLPVDLSAGWDKTGDLVMSPVPEPGTFALAGLGAAALLIFRRRK